MAFIPSFRALETVFWMAVAFVVMPSKLAAIKLACLLALLLGITWILIAVAMAFLGWVIKAPKFKGPAQPSNQPDK